MSVDLKKAYALLKREMPAHSLMLSDLVEYVVDHWDRRVFEHHSDVAKAAILRLVALPLWLDPTLSARARELAQREAPHLWSKESQEHPVDQQWLLERWKKYIGRGRL